MIRVLHVVNYMDRGGIETMLMNYYRNIDRSQIQFDFLVHRLKEAEYDNEIISMGGKIFRLPKLNPMSIKFRKECDKFFKTHKEYKIVHFHLNSLSSLPMYYAKKNNIKNRIAHSHSSNINCNFLKKPIKEYYRKKITKYSTQNFACSDVAGKWLFKNKNFDIFINAIKIEEYLYNENVRLKIRKKLGLKVDDLVIGNVANFSRVKNHILLIEIFKEVYKYFNSSKLLLVGEGTLYNKIFKKIKKYNLESNVIFLGSVNNVNEVLQAMDIFVFPSLFEGLGISVIEAQASGLPCIVSDAVPKDVFLIENIYSLKLNDSLSKWAQAIIKTKEINNDRLNNYEILKSSCYDVSKQAIWYNKFCKKIY